MHFTKVLNKIVKVDGKSKGQAQAANTDKTGIYQALNGVCPNASGVC